MKLKINYVYLPAVTIAVAVGGSFITSAGMDWYRTLVLPGLAPAGSVIGSIWTVIFILSTIAALLVWNQQPRPKNFSAIVWLFAASAALNLFWSAVFFGWHQLGWAIVEMVVLNLANLVLIIKLWPKNKPASILLWPYFIWVCFATYLAGLIWRLN
ncbi:MAG: TspO/MBR family protein [Patescibacteria group bacterium]